MDRREPSSPPSPAARARPPLPPTPPPEPRAEARILGGRSNRARAIGFGRSMMGANSNSPVTPESHAMEASTPGEGSSRAPRMARDASSVIDLSAEMADGSPPYSEVLHIPNSKVGLVIGREGRHVGFVQNQTGTRISIARDSWDGAKRRVEIEGAPDRCREARALITRLVETSDDRGREVAEGAIGALFAGLDFGDAARATVATEADVASRAELANEEDARYDERSADFIGSSAMGRVPPPGSRLGPPTATMTIPHTKVGMIIGRGGDNVKYIQQRTRARIQIQTDAETPEGAPSRTVFLRGPVDCCRHAARLINDMCMGRVLIHSPLPGGVQSPTTPAGDESVVGVGGTRGAPAPSYPRAAFAPPMHGMEYQPMPSAYYPPFFGQQYTGLYNPPPYAQAPDPNVFQAYWSQFAPVYYGQPPPMLPAYPLHVGRKRDDGTTYYDQPTETRETENHEKRADATSERPSADAASPTPMDDAPPSTPTADDAPTHVPETIPGPETPDRDSETA